jgi:hypothetical protein
MREEDRQREIERERERDRKRKRLIGEGGDDPFLKTIIQIRAEGENLR